MHYQIPVLALLARAVLAAPVIEPEQIQTHNLEDLESRDDTDGARIAFPFNKIVAFGDDFTDNGQGSFAHGITGNPKTGEGIHLWGADTWTDGPVSVTFLAQSLGMPLTYDYAFGSAGGAQYIGSKCDNNLLPKSANLNAHAQLSNGKLVPDALGQINNYTTGGQFNTDVDKTLHFLWTGNNDMIASLGWLGRFTICSKDTLCHPGQQKFIGQLIGCMNSSLTNLINAGAKHVLVPSVYPRNLSPWTTQYITPDPALMADFGGVITGYNNALKKLINSLNKKYGTKIMYYDANAFLVKAMNAPDLVSGAGYNYTCVDGCGKQIPGNTGNFDLWFKTVVINKKPSQFYWMTTVVPSSTVLKGLAADMFKFVKKQYK